MREIKVLSDVNVNHMHQPRSFAAIVNKCLSGKTPGHDSLHLSRAQIIWGMYHNKNVDYVHLLWEDLVYQVENKNSKKNNDMCYPRFTKFIIVYIMKKDLSIPRRNKIFWHTVKDDPMFTMIRVISKHQTTRIYGAIIPKKLTNQAMIESKAYKTYYAIMDTTQAQQKALDDALVGQKFEDPPFEKEILSFIRDLGHMREIKVLSDVNVNHMHQPRSFAAIINKCLSGKTTGHDSLHLSRAQIIWGMYHNKKVDYVYLLWEDLVYQVENKNSKKNNDMCYPRFTKFIIVYIMKKDLSIPRRNKIFWHTVKDNPMFTMIRVISKHQTTRIYGAILLKKLTNQAMIESKAYKTYYAYAIGKRKLILKHLLRRSMFKLLKTNDSKLQLRYVSTMPGIDESVSANRFVCLNSKKSSSKAFTLSSNLNKEPKVGRFYREIIKEQVKVQVKEQVTKILPRIEKLVNEQLEAEVLTHSSNEAKTSHTVVAYLSELELKKILIDKIEHNKSIYRSNQQKTLYEALIDAYETDKVILDTYKDTVTIKRYRDDEDDDEEPYAGSNRGSKRRQAVKELESTSEPKEKTIKSAGKSKEGSKSHQKSTGNSKDDSRDSFKELMDTPLDFSVFMMNQLKVDTLAPELLDSPTFDLMKGSCKILVELEYFLEEVCKASTDQLDWNTLKAVPDPYNFPQMAE
nr:hypothetical protein [Tanacetum cinerariifolium]